MERWVTIGLIAGSSVLAACGGYALARIDVPAEKEPKAALERPARSSVHASTRSRFGDAFDLDHDGAITRDEVEKSDASKFAEAAAGGVSLNLEQFIAWREKSSGLRVAQAFRHLDWNGDNKLSLDEYAAPVRVKFALAEDATGAQSCDRRSRTALKVSTGRRSAGRSRFCAENDLNRDGVVTRAEFDDVTLRRFSAISGTSKFMTLAQYTASLTKRDRSANERAFKRLDADNDGRVSQSEFSEQDFRSLARLDVNRDGTVTRDELGHRNSISRRRRTAHG
jgi:Ca2+-binding EF-hand superfamily protein